MQAIKSLTKGIQSQKTKGELHFIATWKSKNGTVLDSTYKHKMKFKEFKVV